MLVRDLLFLGLIAVMPFPVRLLSDYTKRPLAVAIYAVAFITSMQLQRLIWLDVTRPEHRDLLREPVSEGVRTASAGCCWGRWWCSARRCRWGCSPRGMRRWCGW